MTHDYHHTYNRLLRTGTAHLADPASTSQLRRALDDLDARVRMTR